MRKTVDPDRPVWAAALPESGQTVVGRYPRLLDALHERVAPGALVASASGYVLASPALLPTAAPGPLARFGLAVAPGGRTAVTAGTAAEHFATGLLDLHHELVRGAVRHVMRHLDARTSGGTTLLNKQLIQGQLADIAVCLAEDEAMPAQRRHGDRPARWRTHQRLVAAGRQALMLLGANGFLATGPAPDLHLAEVTGNVYLHPGAPPGPKEASTND